MDKKNLGTRLSEAMAIILAVCVAAIAIALTAKLIIWIL